MHNIDIRIMDQISEIMILGHGFIEFHLREFTCFCEMRIINITKCNQTITLIACKMIL